MIILSKDCTCSLNSCADLESFFRGVNEWIQIQLKLGRLRPTSEMPFKMAFRWCADDGQTLNAGLVAL